MASGPRSASFKHDQVQEQHVTIPIDSLAIAGGPRYKETTVIRCLLAESVTSAVGLKEALLSHNFAIRFIWSLLFLSGALSTAYFMYKTTSEYLDEPTATKVKFNVSASLDMPPIAICPAAWWDSSKAISLGLSRDALKYSLTYIDTYPGMELEKISEAKDEFHKFYIKQNFSSLLEYYHKIAIELPVVYTSAEFSNLTIGIKLSDPKTIFLGRHFTGYQICHVFTFRPIGSRMTSTSIRIKTMDLSDGIATSLTGIWLILVTDTNFLTSLYPSLHIPAFTRTKVLISTRQLVNLNKPNAPCLEQPASVTSRALDTSYGCALHCHNVEYMKAVKCRTLRHDTVFELGHPSEYCNEYDLFTNENVSYAHLKNSDFDEDVEEKCVANCLPLCDKIVHDTSIHWQQKLTDDEQQQHSKKIVADIFFGRAGRYEGETVAFIEVSTYSFTSFVNNVGGTLGLFIGATLMTFAQIILFFVDLCYKRCIHK